MFVSRVNCTQNLLKKIINSELEVILEKKIVSCFKTRLHYIPIRTREDNTNASLFMKEMSPHQRTLYR